MVELNEITEADICVLSQQPMEVLAEWWCCLNRWEWPDGLPDKVPEDLCLRSIRPIKIMWWIEDAIGDRAISRHWNRDMSEEAFNDFWRGTYEGHAASKQRHEHRMRSEIRERRSTSR